MASAGGATVPVLAGGLTTRGCGRSVESEEWQPSPNVPAPLSRTVALGRRIDGLVMRVSAHLANWIGTSRVNALRARLQALRPKGNEPYRPVREDPRFFSSRAVVDASHAAKELCAPVVDAAQGLARTKAYIAWRFGGQV